jgi:hypothetical protein
MSNFSSLPDDKKAKLYRQFMDEMAKSMASIGTFSTAFGTSNISPTDKNAKGRYEYQVPEQDEQGTLYGYKVLTKCNCGCGRLTSPRYPVEWNNGELVADRVPQEDSMHGIHCTKRPDHPGLATYQYGSTVLVHCALSGTIVETEQGFRAEHAQIVGVLEDGHWQSYQNYQRRSYPYPRRNSWEEEYKTRWDSWNKDQGNWPTIDIDPKA